MTDPSDLASIYIIPDFVNRKEQLAILWKMARGEIEACLALIGGRKGMGKSYLLQEFQSECQDQGGCVTLIDFENKNWSLDYNGVITRISTDLGPQGFEPLTQASRQAVEQIEAQRLLAQLNTGLGQQSAGIAQASAPPQGNALPQVGVQIGGGSTVTGPVIGRDYVQNLNWIQYVIQGDDPFVQELIKSNLTRAFQQCLAVLTVERKAVLLFDGWDAANQPLRDWLRDNLFRWVLNRQLPQAMVVVAGNDGFDGITPARTLTRLTMPGLPPDAIEAYWIEKRGLPKDKLAEVIDLSHGTPSVVTLLAEEASYASRQTPA